MAGIILYWLYLAAVPLHNPYAGGTNKVWHIIIGGLTFWHRKALKNYRMFIAIIGACPLTLGRQGV